MFLPDTDFPLLYQKLRGFGSQDLFKASIINKHVQYPNYS